MMTIPALKLVVMKGDGIGPEITEATLAVLDAAAETGGLAFDYEEVLIGFDALHRDGSTIPEAAIEAARAADGVILGPVSHNEYPPVAEGGLNPSGVLRKRLDLYANIRPARNIPGLPTRCGDGIDLVVVRENTEGFYSDRNMFAGNGEFMPTPDVALAVRKITRDGVMRLAETAFRLAMTRRRKLCSVHKANVFRLSDGLWLECTREVASRYPDVEYEERLIDAMAALLVRDPGQFDVIATSNMFGDILSDQASEISGSLGLAASLNAGDEHAVAQAQHGSAPDIAGRGIANPASLIGSAAMLLDRLGERRELPALRETATRIADALEATISDPATRTRDLGGPLGTGDFTAAVAKAVTQ
ncbi:isocitrate/isopropylmalate dehydrogenase family protein [Roseitranquillus sediminis]|uniref:isocitrate/isopropylmalate dehydrogenase family protein n=1 Tax=Roseitranquillus sediminis TaxID=2809051 RepID=UPI001D0CD2C0|nr:isocitrate/isopropylmalate dehydrogenase family protein [Roseitranquillus sediminis]MBM9593884.1 isocitrate/isopropylmalate dehydrogenase family protein [Roseitranquillus sediminis]